MLLCNEMSVWSFKRCLWYWYCFIFVFTGSITEHFCMHLPEFGFTIPRGDIILEHGNNLNITCHLHNKYPYSTLNNASSYLVFKRNNKELPMEYVTIIDSTSAMLFIEAPPKSKRDNYYCYFEKDNLTKLMISMNVVAIGEAPQNVTDFSCLSRNQENLTCTWTAPDNSVPTSYTLTYFLSSRSSRRCGLKRTPIKEADWIKYSCPLIEDKEDGTKKCFWNLSTTPQYRLTNECYYFTLTMNNIFGIKENHFTFEHQKYIRPNPPENFTVVGTTPHSVTLSWAIPFSMKDFKPGLDHRILYQCEYYEKMWHNGGILYQVKSENVTFVLKDLKYAHAVCDIRVSIRSSVADKDDESMWSESAKKTARTESKVPDRPPQTVAGAFESLPLARNSSYDDNIYDVYVYWQQLPEEQHNGRDFTYELEVENHPTMKPTDISSTYAKFTRVRPITFVVNIWSKNDKGRSAEKSTLTVPGKRLDYPSNFIKEFNNSSYELSWGPPKDQGHLVTSYIIFSCSKDRNPVNSCTKNVNWTVVSSNVTHLSWEAENDVTQFAVAANNNQTSSGLLFAKCTVVAGQSLAKVNDVWINKMGSNFMEVKWKLDCQQRRRAIQGFLIDYCQNRSPTNASCKNGTEQNLRILGGVDIESGLVKGLRPYTSYRLTVSYISLNGSFSQVSDPPTFNATEEDKPDTPPLNIRIFNVTNSSIAVKWNPPINMNGLLRDYYIYFNGTKRKVENNANETTISNLMSNEKYAVSVEACTVKCSGPSDPKYVVIKMGEPGEVYPYVKVERDSYIVISWERPKPTRGPINYYQVKIRERLDEDDKNSYKNVTAQNYTLEGCASEKKPYYIAVRAVNIINDEHVAGPWSRDLETSCTPYSSVIYVFGGSISIFVAIALCWLFRRGYTCVKSEKDIGVILPEGLDRPVPLVESRKPEKTKGGEDPPDGEYLLKTGDTRITGDSSGCSSGRESISSSIESNVHISPSDSGTEQPRSPSLRERKNSVRLRNVSVPRTAGNLGYVTTDTLPSANILLKPPTLPTENYCVFGVDPSATKTDTPYIPLTDLSGDLSTPPPPYVMTGDLINRPNPGYVSYPVTEQPSDKHMGYVVAGLPTDLLPPNLLQLDPPKPVAEEEKPLYVRTSESIPALKPPFTWQQQQPQLGLPKSGYVSVGDALPPKPFTQVTKGYVPHRQFEGKSLKED